MARLILLDIEGTVLPIEFIHGVVFPFARKRVSAWVHAQWATLGRELERLSAGYPHFPIASPPHLNTADPDSVARYLEWLMDKDSKVTPLKTIQARICEEGFSKRQLQPKFFPDVPEALRRWHAAGTPVAIFSSGSVQMQKLLFKHSGYGDLTSLIADWFDTETGKKKHPSSYRDIAKKFDVLPPEVHFFSDAPAELDAAKQAGIGTALVVRTSHAIVTDFAMAVR